jgi:hypothetical protein
VPLPGGPPFGQFLDSNQWDGSDFFMADNNSSIFVPGSTAAKVEGLKLSNAVLEPASLEPIPPH